MNIEKLIQDYDQHHRSTGTIYTGDLNQVRSYAEQEGKGDPEALLFYAISAALRAGYAAGYKRGTRNQQHKRNKGSMKH